VGSVTVTIVEEISSNRFILKCARCEGTGKDYQYSNKAVHSTAPCSVCNGKGLLLVVINGEIPFVKCARCDGTGRGYLYSNSDERSTAPCESCKGIGAQPISGSLQIIK